MVDIARRADALGFSSLATLGRIAYPSYDELVLVLEGDGVLHTGGRDHVLAPGTCAHLPPGQLHSLENTGPATLRVLGVFHPADSPAAKEDRTNAGA